MNRSSEFGGIGCLCFRLDLGLIIRDGEWLFVKVVPGDGALTLASGRAAFG